MGGVAKPYVLVKNKHLDALLDLLKANPYGLESGEIRAALGISHGMFYSLLDQASRVADLAEDDNGGFYLLSAREEYLETLRRQYENRCRMAQTEGRKSLPLM